MAGEQNTAGWFAGNGSQAAGSTTSAGGSQYGQTISTPGGTSSYVYSPYTQAQTGLANAQAGAVHDQLQGVQLEQGDKMARFNALLPMLSGQLGNLGLGPYSAGGTNTAPPPITAGPTLNSQQIQQQVNQSRAANDQSTAGQIQSSNNRLAGAGFGANSPVAAMLNQGYQNQNMATNTANETNTRLNAAQANAGQLLNSQQALSNQGQAWNQLDINRRAPVLAARSQLFAALSGMV